ncbi:MAG: sporulation integral membrane protein YtvI [Peptococcaceae bacterium]|nr:sporulation integral membrane protein YtvI [Peptococcaceae bacterium]
MQGYQKKERFIVNVIFYFIIAGLVFAVSKYLLPVLAPFLVALVVTMVLNPLIRFVGKHEPRLRKPFAILLCAAFYIILAYLLLNFGWQLTQKVGDLIARIPALFETQIAPALWMLYDRIQDLATQVDPGLAQEIDAIFNETMQNMRVYITEFSMQAVGLLTGTLTALPGLFLSVLITIISTFFMITDFDFLLRQAFKLIPSGRRDAAQTTVVYAKNILVKYIKSYSLIFSITFIELSVGFTILHIPNSVLIGLLVAIFDILPVLGTGGILIPWAIIVAILGNGGLAFGLIFLYVFILVVRNIIEPRIVGKQIGLHPLVTLVGMFIGLKLFGVIGLFGIPIALSILVNMDRAGVVHIFPRDEEEVSTV